MSSKALTRKQLQILQIIQAFQQSHSHAPTLRELAEILGLSSPATLHKHINNLKAKGLLKDSSRAWRNLMLTKPVKSSQTGAPQIPIIGSVAKGEKSELYLKTSFLELPKSLASIAHPLYGFVVRDNSFNSLHMQLGDLLVIEARNEARNGEMILASSRTLGTQIGRFLASYTDKQIDLGDSLVSLDSSDLVIQGILVSLIRKY